MDTPPLPPCPLPWVQEQVSMASQLYYQMGGIAQYWASPQTLSQTAMTLQWAQTNHLPLMVLGAGTNSIVADGHFPGLALNTQGLLHHRWLTPELLWALGGVPNSQVAALAWEQGRGGAHWMHRLPGALGATVRMNARCFGGEMDQIVTWVVSLTPQGYLRARQGPAVFRGYKDTLFMDTPEVVVGALIHLPQEQDQNTIRVAMDTCEAQRLARHHFDHPSCGSTFKNNYTVGKPSGKIFEELGFKGRRHGGAQVSEHHANFIWNLGQARSTDVLELCAEMRETAAASGYPLDLEVEPLGAFPTSLLQRCGLTATPGPRGPLSWRGLVEPSPSVALPATLLEGPWFPYGPQAGTGPKALELLGPTAPTSQLLQVAQWAQAKPQDIVLEWRCHVAGDGALSRIFPLAPPPTPHFQEGLWAFSVAELFLGSPHSLGGPYLEFEMTPQGHWVALAFNGPRQRAPGHSPANGAQWPGVETFMNTNPTTGITTFGLRLPKAVIAPIVGQDLVITAQCALSLGLGVYGLFPPWQEQDAQPNFHQPQRFFPIKLIE